MSNKVSDNLNPKLILVEGSAPANPASGNQSLFIDSADHKVKRVNSSGTVVNIEAGGGSSTLAGDTDVSLSSLANFDQLQYSTVDSKFHNVAGGMVRIAPIQTLGSATASVSFSSIPSGYSALRLIATGRISEAASDDWINLTFNSDTGSNYDADWYTANTSTITGSDLVASTSARVGDFPGSTAPANMPGIIIIDIPFYANSTFYKQAIASSFVKYATASGNDPLRAFGIQWRSTSAISTITLTPGGGNFITGCIFALYGVV